MTIAAIITRVQSPLALQFWCAVGFCAGIGLFLYGFRLLQRRRLILDTPFSKIRSASLGMVEISGLAVGPYTMITPITARPCYYYRTVVWEWKQSGKNKDWVKVAAECMHVPFFVDDNTGRMLVDPRGADLDLHRDFQQEFCDSFFTTKDPAPPNVLTFLGRHGIVTNNKIKVEEFCIKPKNSLFILGTLAENSGVELSPHPVREAEPVNVSTRPLFISLDSLSSSESDAAGLKIGSFSVRLGPQPPPSPPEVIRVSEPGPAHTAAMTQQQKIAAALLKAGISNPAAWSAAGVSSGNAPAVMTDPEAAAVDNGSNSAAHGNGFDPHPAVVLRKGENNKTFLISWRSQQEVARSLGWKCVLMIWGGPALAFLSLYVFLTLRLP